MNCQVNKFSINKSEKLFKFIFCKQESGSKHKHIFEKKGIHSPPEFLIFSMCKIKLFLL